MRTIIKIKSEELQNFIITLDCFEARIQEVDTFDSVKFVCVKFLDVSDYNDFLTLLEVVTTN